MHSITCTGQHNWAAHPLPTLEDAQRLLARWAAAFRVPVSPLAMVLDGADDARAHLPPGNVAWMVRVPEVRFQTDRTCDGHYGRGALLSHLYPGGYILRARANNAGYEMSSPDYHIFRAACDAPDSGPRRITRPAALIGKRAEPYQDA